MATNNVLSCSILIATTYNQATDKQLMNEPDVLMRFTTFPVEWLPEQRWLKNPVDLPAFKEKLNRIADDLILSNDNSLGLGKTPLENAKPKRIDKV